jgi:hypothetical protein
MYYNSSYTSISVNLWIFIDDGNFERDNYADYDLGRDYTRYAFRERVVRISNRPVERVVMERIVRQTIHQAPVAVREIRADNRTIKVVVPSGNAPAERIHQQSPKVVRQVIAPAFAKEQRQFKGNASRAQAPVAKIFRQENEKPRVETLPAQQVINSARQVEKNREQKMVQNVKTAKQRTEKLKKEGKIEEPRKGKARGR